MGRILKWRLLGFATCVYRPWWKFWIRIYIAYLENGNWDVVCWDCRNVCFNYKLWLKWRRKI